MKLKNNIDLTKPHLKMHDIFEKGKTEKQIRAWLKVKLRNLLFVVDNVKLKKLEQRIAQLDDVLSLEIREMRK